MDNHIEFEIVKLNKEEWLSCSLDMGDEILVSLGRDFDEFWDSFFQNLEFYWDDKQKQINSLNTLAL